MSRRLLSGEPRSWRRADYYRAPIDECYKLVGTIRTHWRGISGGAEVWMQIVAFFDDLKRRATETSVHA